MLAAIVILLAIAPLFISRSLIQDLFFVLTMIALAQCWNLLAGYGGLVSVGQQAFVGLGAYIGFAGAILWGLNPLVALLLAGVVGVLLAIPTSYVVFRLQGAYFAIGTWVAAEVYRLVFAQWKALGGGTGTSLPSGIAKSMFGVGWVREVLDVKNIRGSRHRFLLDCPWSSRSSSSARFMLSCAPVPDLRCRPFATTSAPLKALRKHQPGQTGCLPVCRLRCGPDRRADFLQRASITPDSAFSVIDWTAYVLFIVIIGGIGTLEGPIIGALILFFCRTGCPISAPGI